MGILTIGGVLVLELVAFVVAKAIKVAPGKHKAFHGNRRRSDKHLAKMSSQTRSKSTSTETASHDQSCGASDRT